MFNIVKDGVNKDCRGMSYQEAKSYYLDLHQSYGRKNWKPKLPLPDIEVYEGRKVLRCDLVGGFKAHAAEKLIAHIPNDVLVYCAPRTGHAAQAISMLAEKYGKKAVFFAPSSKQPTYDQAVVLTYGMQLRFLRIAAMPNLNRAAKAWAEKHGAAFLPFGLANTPEITAGIVDLCRRVGEKYGDPKEVWCATSTGTMIRGLQIGWPKAKMASVAVARNIHAGEVGRADIVSSNMAFLQKSKIQPEFDTTACYDAKAWERCVKEGSKNSLFINVGSDSLIHDRASSVDLSKIDSYRDWGDDRDLRKKP